MLVGATSMYSGSWLEGSGAVYAENQALRWLADLAGLPDEAGGAFVQGGTIGNLSALVAARESARHRRGDRPARWAVCVTAETHSSVKHALTHRDGRRRGRGARRRARPPRRRAAARARSTRWPTTSATASSPWSRRPARPTSGSSTTSPASPRWRSENGWWLHVDAAYGGAGLAAPSVAHLFAGVEHADSFIVDPHKWLFAPFDACALHLPRPGAGPGRPHPARQLPRPGERRGRVEPVGLRHPAHPARARSAVLVLPRRPRHRRLHARPSSRR